MNFFRPKDQSGNQAPPPTGQRNTTVDFKGQTLSNERHATTTDSEARKWRIVELPGYANDHADMVELAYILFEATDGEFAFGCVTRVFAGGDHAAVKFGWNGNDDERSLRLRMG